MPPKRNKLSLEQRELILQWHSEGKTQTEISKMLGRHRSIISRLLKKHRETGTSNETKIGGRPRVYTERDDRRLVRACKNRRVLSIRSIKKTLDTQYGSWMSVSTIQRRLSEQGMKKRVLKKALVIRKPNVVKRKKWCKARRKWKVEEHWRKFIFSDECSVQLGRQVP